jgi:hypothetical protein
MKKLAIILVLACVCTQAKASDGATCGEAVQMIF